MSRDVDAAVKAGWIAESDNKGSFYVLDQASRVLDEGFEQLKGSRTSGNARSRTTTRRPRTPAETPSAFKDVETISPKLQGVIDYHKLKTGGDKLLWAVFAARQAGVLSVSNKELVWLTDRLGTGIKSGDIAWCYRANHKAGYLNRSTQDDSIRVTPDGEAYLRSKTVEPKS